MARADERASVDRAELEKFAAAAARWWDPHGPFRPLHRLNPVRLAFIRDHLCAHFGRDPKAANPLAGLSLVDIGCGGGLLSEPLSRLGAEVLGIDAEPAGIAAAEEHARETGASVRYRAAGAEELLAEARSFDAVIAMEVIEHVADVDAFLAATCGLAKPGGAVFLATLNRTLRAFALGVVAAEYVLGWLPRGTHDWRRFVRPSELARGLRRHDVETKALKGVGYNPMTDSWGLSPDLGVNYMAFGIKR
jgi:2-polyprenyl-6-hydroxyphenyl methylase / 3-demethylubiquinone-9 3-methyltransferase